MLGLVVWVIRDPGTLIGIARFVAPGPLRRAEAPKYHLGSPDMLRYGALLRGFRVCQRMTAQPASNKEIFGQGWMKPSPDSAVAANAIAAPI